MPPPTVTRRRRPHAARRVAPWVAVSGESPTLSCASSICASDRPPRPTPTRGRPAAPVLRPRAEVPVSAGRQRDPVQRRRRRVLDLRQALREARRRLLLFEGERLLRALLGRSSSVSRPDNPAAPPLVLKGLGDPATKDHIDFYNVSSRTSLRVTDCLTRECRRALGLRPHGASNSDFVAPLRRPDADLRRIANDVGAPAWVCLLTGVPSTTR